MGKIRVTVEFEEGKLMAQGGDGLTVTKYGLSVDAQGADPYDLGDAVRETIQMHRDGKPALARLEDFN